MDWLAVQRLKAWGLLEERGTKLKLTRLVGTPFVGSWRGRRAALPARCIRNFETIPPASCFPHHFGEEKLKVPVVKDFEGGFQVRLAFSSRYC
jgi:hypothetical protein